MPLWKPPYQFPFVAKHQLPEAGGGFRAPQSGCQHPEVLALAQPVPAVLLAQVEHCAQGEVHAPLLLGAEMADDIAQPGHVDRPHLLDEHRRLLPLEFDHGAERGWPGARRGRGYEDDRARQHRVGLHHHAVPATLLLVPHAPRQSKLEDVTAAHGAAP